jgi:peptidyl-prolyl cis-trans isomerase A (cyclophilin A)
MLKPALALVLVCAAACASIPATPAVPPLAVVFETTMGEIVIEVNVAKAPLTSANFLRYVDEGWYDAGRFHRTVRPETETNTTHPIQVIQAGRRQVPRAEAPTFPPLVLERTRDTGLTHVDGAVSMARVAGQPDSGASDFFIAIGPQPSLDFAGGRNTDGQGFAVFGRVISGMDTVKKIQAAPVRAGTQTLAPPIVITKARRK